MSDIHRVGFACKFVEPNPEKFSSKKMLIETEQKFNQQTTTLTALSKLNSNQVYNKLLDIIKHNINSINNMFKLLSNKPLNQRMFRLSSDLLPFYTCFPIEWFYNLPEIKTFLETNFAKLGEFARANSIRLSFHPGQYTVLNSLNSQTVENSIKDFEYHVKMASWMGFGGSWHDEGFVINIHGGSKESGLESLLNTIKRLSVEARNLVSIENDEVSFSTDDVLTISNNIPVVLDLHHHWINSGGEYILPSDDRFKKIIDSWKGIRPKIHVSMSRNDYINNHSDSILPNYALLINDGYKLQKLRAHSDDIWNKAFIEYCSQFLPYADIMIEAKLKNIAQQKFIEYLDILK